MDPLSTVNGNFYSSRHPSISYSVIEDGESVLIAINAIPGIEQAIYENGELRLERASYPPYCIEPLASRIKAKISAGAVFIVEFGFLGNAIAEHEIRRVP